MNFFEKVISNFKDTFTRWSSLLSSYRRKCRKCLKSTIFLEKSFGDFGLPPVVRFCFWSTLVFPHIYTLAEIKILTKILNTNRSLSWVANIIKSLLFPIHRKWYLRSSHIWTLPTLIWRCWCIWTGFRRRLICSRRRSAFFANSHILRNLKNWNHICRWCRAFEG